MRVSFDFDSTLQRPEIQKIAESMLAAGNEVWIVTSRSEHYSNLDVVETARKVGIPLTNIIFTEYEDKAGFLKGFDFHFDDDPCEIETLMSANNGCTGILTPVKIKANYQIP